MGAPFDGDGKVFIYRGSDAGIETKPAQVSPEVSYNSLGISKRKMKGRISDCLTE